MEYLLILTILLGFGCIVFSALWLSERTISAETAKHAANANVTVAQFAERNRELMETKHRQQLTITRLQAQLRGYTARLEDDPLETHKLPDVPG